jgi:hypothetical protein
MAPHVPFRITWHVERRRETLLEPGDELADASDVFLSLRRFLRAYQGVFTIWVGAVGAGFDLDPDLSTVFEDLPGVLEALAQDVSPAVLLHFFEQGTDLTVELERRNSVRVRFLKGAYAGRRFDDLSSDACSVRPGEFFSEWLHFLRDIVDRVVRFDPATAGSFDSYGRRLVAIARMTGIEVEALQQPREPPRPALKLALIGAQVDAQFRETPWTS